MGWTNVFHCEINPFCQRILRYHFPESESLTDIKETNFTPYRGKIDIISGGFPCQPFSVAGERKGTADNRHLWPEMLRAIREIAPRYVVGENVRGLLNWNGGVVFDQVYTDLENEGYEVWAGVLPAASVGAPHRRDRVWIVANADHKRTSRGPGEDESKSRSEGVSTRDEIQRADESNRLRRLSYPRTDWHGFPVQPALFPGDDGLSSRLDGITLSKWRHESVKAAGNAIVPQVAYQIFKALLGGSVE